MSYLLPAIKKMVQHLVKGVRHLPRKLAFNLVHVRQFLKRPSSAPERPSSGVGYTPRIQPSADTHSFICSSERPAGRASKFPRVPS